MNNRGSKWIAAGIILMLAGCSSSRVVRNTIGEEPGMTPKGNLVQYSNKATPETNVVQESVVGSKAKLWPATLAVLKQEGYDIENEKPRDGTLKTKRKSLQLDTSYCVYGSATNPQYPLAEKSVTYVTFDFTVEDNAIAIRTDVQAVTLMGGQVKELDVICVSLGKLERELLAKIRKQVKTKP